MIYRIIAAGIIGCLMMCSIGCSKDKPTPPKPVEASDPNTVSFDDGIFDFVEIICDDKQSAEGTLSVVEVQGNKMLRFNDDHSLPLEGKVQKLSISAAALLSPENLAKVRSIQFDVYADALDDSYVNQDGKNVKVPGTISCGGGTVTAKKDSNNENFWYDFEGFEGGEYNFDMSGAVHGEFKFLLAASDVCWSEDMDAANFLIMRWGCENASNLYVDNIVFYDESGKSLPLLDNNKTSSS